MPMQPTPIPGFSDPVSSFSHLFVGVPIFVVLTFVLLWRGRGIHLSPEQEHDPRITHEETLPRLITLGIYGLSNVILFAISGTYHLLDRQSMARHVLQVLDHAAIFLLIAGTFAPAHYILFTGWKRWGPILFVWTAAILGIILKSIFFNDLSEFLGLSLYLGLGWVGGISGFFVWYQYGWKLFQPLVFGAISYTLGAILDYLQWPVLIPGVLGGHELFHIFVVIGACWFGYFIYLIAPGHLRRVPRLITEEVQ